MAADEKVVLQEEEIGRAPAHHRARDSRSGTPTGRLRPSSASTAAAPFSNSRRHALLEEILGEQVPLGDLDIGFYRDDVATRSDAPVLHAVRTSTSTSPG